MVSISSPGLLPSETAIGCCPTGFQCSQSFNAGIGQTCISIATAGSFAAVQCSSGQSVGFTYLGIPATVTETNSGSESAFVLETFTVSAPLFQLNFQSSDLPATMTGSITISTDANTSSTSTPAETGSPAGEGLSTGAKAGIGAGVGVATVALIGALLFFLLRRRKRTPTAELAAQSEPTEAPATEAPKQELPGQQPRHNVPAELQVNLVPSELPGNHSPGYG